MMLPKLGIIAGSGTLPSEIINHCDTTGRPFFVIALKDQAEESTVASVPHKWVRLGAAGKTIKILRENDVEEIVLAGSVVRPSLNALRPDLWAAKFFAKTGAARLGDDGLLSAIIAALQEQEGFTVVGSDDLLPNLVAPEGSLGHYTPMETDQNDIIAGISAARILGAQDVGQAVVVRAGHVIGEEDQHGTDALLRSIRPLTSGKRCGVLVKTAKPAQERRADLPTIGPDTVKGVYTAGLSGVALEANNALILNREQVIEAADQYGLFVIGVTTT